MSTSPSSTTTLSKHLWYKHWSPDSIDGANSCRFLHQQQHSSGRELLRPSGQLFFLLSWPELYDKVILLSLTSEDAKFEVEGMKMMLLLNIAILDLKWNNDIPIRKVIPPSSDKIFTFESTGDCFIDRLSPVTISQSNNELHHSCNFIPLISGPYSQSDKEQRENILACFRNDCCGLKRQAIFSVNRLCSERAENCSVTSERRYGYSIPKLEKRKITTTSSSLKLS